MLVFKDGFFLKEKNLPERKNDPGKGVVQVSKVSNGQYLDIRYFRYLHDPTFQRPVFIKNHITDSRLGDAAEKKNG